MFKNSTTFFFYFEKNVLQYQGYNIILIYQAKATPKTKNHLLITNRTHTSPIQSQPKIAMAFHARSRKNNKNFLWRKLQCRESLTTSKAQARCWHGAAVRHGPSCHGPTPIFATNKVIELLECSLVPTGGQPCIGICENWTASNWLVTCRPSGHPPYGLVQKTKFSRSGPMEARTKRFFLEM